MNRSSYYEELCVELFEIIRKKREIYKNSDNIDDLKEFKKMDAEEIRELLNTEYKILRELLQGNLNSAQDFGFVLADGLQKSSK